MRIRSKTPEPSRLQGFTLIEVMAVAVIVLILATLAYPSYQEAVRQSRRAEAQAALMQLMQQQERYYSQHNSYIAFSRTSAEPDAKRFKWYSGNTPSDSAYEISGVACEGQSIRNCIAITASPGTSRVNANYRDPVCGDLVFTSIGAKKANLPECWK